MESRLVDGNALRGPIGLEPVSEGRILTDIEYFRSRLAELPVDTDRYSQARRHVYITLLQQRHRLLAAFRAGRPEDWPDFPVEEIKA